MLHHAPSCSISRQKLAFAFTCPLTILSRTCETSLHSSCISLMVLRAPLHLCCIGSKGTTSTTYCVSGNVAPSLPDPEGQIHESYAKTVQDLKALAHQLWDQGDMLDEMRQWMRLFMANQYIFVCIYLCIHLPYQTDAELCPSIVSPLCSELQVPL